MKKSLAAMAAVVIIALAAAACFSPWKGEDEAVVTLDLGGGVAVNRAVLRANEFATQNGNESGSDNGGKDSDVGEPGEDEFDEADLFALILEHDITFTGTSGKYPFNVKGIKPEDFANIKSEEDFANLLSQKRKHQFTVPPGYYTITVEAYVDLISLSQMGADPESVKEASQFTRGNTPIATGTGKVDAVAGQSNAAEVIMNWAVGWGWGEDEDVISILGPHITFTPIQSISSFEINIDSDLINSKQDIGVTTDNGLYDFTESSYLYDEKKLSICVQYNGEDFSSKPIELTFNLIDKETELPLGIEGTIRVKFIDGLSVNNRIPVNAENIANFNSYANGEGRSRHYLQDGDIVFSQYDTWTPIGSESAPFTGSYDVAISYFNQNDAPEYYKISGLTINANEDYQGLFGVVGSNDPKGTIASVENVILEEVNIQNSASYTGGIAGIVRGGGKIEACYVFGSVTGSTEGVGGIVGKNEGEMLNCYALVDVSGSGNNIGGVVGTNSGTMINCNTMYGLISISGGDNVGGVLGENKDGNVENCYSSAYYDENSYANINEISGINNVGGVVGFLNGGTIKDCSSNVGNVNGDGDNVGGVVGKSQNGTLEDCSSSSEVSGIDNVGGIVGFLESGVVKRCDPSSNGVRGDNNVGGVVGTNQGGTVENCEPVNEVSGIENVGGVVGLLQGDTSTVKECKVRRAVSGLKNVGGVVGYNQGGEIEDCHITTGVSGSKENPTEVSENIGGVVGLLEGGTVTKSSATNGNVEGNSNVGGVVGKSDKDSTNTKESEVSYCYTTVNVSGIINFGGVVGDNNGTVQYCYATGSIESSSNDEKSENVGGVVGINQADGKVANCYTTSRLNSGYRGTDYHDMENAGGVAGNNKGMVTNCYATGEVISGSKNIGGVVGDNEGTVNNCVALYQTLSLYNTNTDTCGRVVGNSVSFALTKNYSRNDTIGWSDGIYDIPFTTTGENVNNGEDINVSQWHSDVWWKDSSSVGTWTSDSPWSTEVWNITNNRLPTLLNMPEGSEQTPTVQQ